MKNKDIFKKSAISLAIVSALSVATVVNAQDQDVDEITVTGTRIRVTDGMAAPTPVTSMTPIELMNFEPGGTVSEQLDALPQFFSTGTAQRGGPTLFGDGGGSYLNMRGLGQNRTLILLDGSRVVPADKRGIVNVDNIPTALVRSVDVITGGASAAYGADALGGVTNFVLDRQFEGLKVSVSTGMNEFAQDGKNYNYSFAGGTKWGDKLNLIGSFEGRHIDEIYRPKTSLDADWFQNWGYITNPSSTGPTRITVPWVAPADRSVSGVISARGSVLNGLQFTDDGKDLMPFVKGDITSVGRGTATSGGPEAYRYNISSASPIQGSGVENRSGFFAAQYQLTDSLSIYAQGLIGRTESSSIGEHSTFNRASPWFITIYRDNAFLPKVVADIMDAEKRTSININKNGSYLGDLEPGAGEYSRTTFTTESYSAGFAASLPNGWDLTGSYQTGESRKKGGEYPSTRVDREALSRDAVRDPATGAIVCNVKLYNPTEAQLAASPAIQGLKGSRTGGPLLSPIGLDNTIRDCVPYNALGTGNMTQEAWNYVHTPKTANSWVKQDFAEILLQGEAYEGWGYGPLSFATGITWREQSFQDSVGQVNIDDFGPPFNDPALGIRGIATAYSGGSPNLHHFSTISFINGKYDVWEWFGELNVPVWESADGGSRIGGNLAFRRSDYSSSGKQDSWKYGLEWQIYEDLRIRATQSRDVREASFQERFDTATGGVNVDDTFTGQRVLVTFLRGGNPNLRPEVADTTVLGAVFEPSFFEGLQFSADWYEVEIEDAVDSITEQQIIDQCFDTGAFCQNLNRDSSGTLVAVSAPFLNLANARVEGVDLEVAYNFEPDFFANELERLSIRALFGKLLERSDTPPGGAPIDQTNSIARPEVTGNLTLRYSAGPWSGTWQQRYISDVLLNNTWVEGVDIDNNTIPTYSFTNLSFAYAGETSSGSEWTLSLAVNNAFDKNPPIVPGPSGQGGGLNNYDEWGRRYQLTLNMNF